VQPITTNAVHSFGNGFCHLEAQGVNLKDEPLVVFQNLNYLSGCFGEAIQLPINMLPFSAKSFAEQTFKPAFVRIH
jgi:hypothetical protein